MDIVSLNDHVAKIHANTEDDSQLFGNIGVTFSHTALQRDRTLYGVDDARKFDQNAVARRTDDAAAEVFNGACRGSRGSMGAVP